MYRVVKMTYQDGVLKPAQDLPFRDRQQVLAIVLPLQEAMPLPQPDLTRVATLREQAANWLSQQPPDAVRLPLRLSEAHESDLDRDFDAILAAIRQRSHRFSSQEIAADVNLALAEARSLSADERSRLETELDALLAEWAADAG
jgi:hypothetical protein